MQSYRSETSSASKVKINPHEITYPELSFSVLFGAIAISITNNKFDLPFSIVVSAFAAACGFLGKYLHSRQTLIKSIPQLNNQTPDSENFYSVSEKYISNESSENIKDGELFYAAFGIKRGFADLIEGRIIKKSPLKHSALVFIPMQTIYELRQLPREQHDSYLANKKTVIVLGRQSPFSRASRFGLWHSLKNYGVKTQIDNEGYYSLLGGAEFELMKSTAVFSGEEIKAIIGQADKVICENQIFDLALNSNCYSASVYMLALAINKLIARSKSHLESNLNGSQIVHQKLQSLCAVMLAALKHNFGQGVLNNKVVMGQVNKTLELAQEFDPELAKKLTSASGPICINGRVGGKTQQVFGHLKSY